EDEGPDRLGRAGQKRVALLGLEVAESPGRLLHGADLRHRIVALVLAPVAAAVVDGPKDRQFAIDHHAHAGLEAAAFVALDVEGANRAQAPAGERFRERLEALAIPPNRARALVRLRPLQELLLRVLEAD